MKVRLSGLLKIHGIFQRIKSYYYLILIICMDNLKDNLRIL